MIRAESHDERASRLRGKTFARATFVRDADGRCRSEVADVRPIIACTRRVANRDVRSSPDHLGLPRAVSVPYLFFLAEHQPPRPMTIGRKGHAKALEQITFARIAAGLGRH